MNNPANDNTPALTAPNTPRSPEFDMLLVSHLAALDRRVRRLSMIGHEEIASDAVASALRNWTNFDATKASFYTWLMMHARSAARDYRVRTARQWGQEISSENLPVRAHQPEQEHVVALHEVLGAAATRQGRAAVFVGMGYSMKEVGKIEGLHPVYANHCARRGRAELREFAGLGAAA